MNKKMIINSLSKIRVHFKRVFRIILALNLIFCDFSLASNYTIQTQDKSVIDVIAVNGIGAEYDIMNEEDSSIHRIRVLDFHYNTETDSMIIEFEKSDPKVTFYSFDEVTIDGRSVSPRQDIGSSSQSQYRSLDTVGDLSVGIGQGALSAGKHLLLQNSSALRDIKKSKLKIADYQRAIEKDLQEMDLARERLFKSMKNLAQQVRSAPELPSFDVSELRKLDLIQAGRSSNLSENEILWKSTDKDFVREAEDIKEKLSRARVHDDFDREFYELSKTSLSVADDLNLDGLVEESGYWLEIAHVAADVLLGLNPFTGVARDIYESLIGKSLISGEVLSDFERGAALTSLITFGLGRHISLGLKALKSTKVFGRSYDKALGFVSPLIDMASDLRITARVHFGEFTSFIKTFFGHDTRAIGRAKDFIAEAGREQSHKLLAQSRAPSVLNRSRHKIVVHTAESINNTVHEGKLPPYKLGTRVFEFTTDKEIKGHFVRVYRGDKLPGPWITEKHVIMNKTPEEIKDILSLPDIPTHMVDIVIPPNVTIRKGIINPIFGSTGSRFSIQYEIAREKVMMNDEVFRSLFQNARRL